MDAAQRMAEKTSLEVEFTRHLKHAAKPFAVDGWHLSKTGLIYNGPDGHWGHIVFRQPQYLQDSQLHLSLTAGALSPYLLTWHNRQDPARSPSSGFVAAHGWILWFHDVLYGRDNVDAPAPLTVPTPRQRHEPDVLGPDTAESWLTSAFEWLVPKTQELCSDEALLNWQLERVSGRDVDFIPLRMAILLARHLGRVEMLPDLLERARVSREANAAGARAEGREPSFQDRSKRYTMLWSHRRFLRFLDETPP